MPQTASALISAALAEVTLARTAEADDITAVTPRLAPILADLAKRRITTTLDSSALPDDLFPDLVRLFAEHIAPLFGRPTSGDAVVASEARLRELTRLDRAGTDYLAKAVLERLEALGAGSDAIDIVAVTAALPRVLADLSARRIASFANEAAISPAAFPHVVTIVVARLHPKAIDPAFVVDAEARLREATRLDTIAGTPLSRAVLERLEALGAGSDAVDAAAASAAIPRVLTDLTARRIITFANEASITPAAFPHVVTIMAARLSPKAVDPALVVDAENRLREASRLSRDTGTPAVKAVLERLEALVLGTDAIDATAVSGAIQSVLDDLAARRLITIANEAAITSAMTPHLVTLVAARVQPKAFSPDASKSAESGLASIARLSAANPLTKAVLEQLEVWGQGASTIDIAMVERRIPGAIDELAIRNVIYISDPDDIEPAALADLTRYIAASLSSPPSFDIIRESERRLRLLRPSEDTSEPVRAEYF